MSLGDIGAFFGFRRRGCLSAYVFHILNQDILKLGISKWPMKLLGASRTILQVLAGVVFAVSFSSCGSYNEPLIEPFDQDGLIKSSYIEGVYTSTQPDNVVFYVESSGSMNGLFRRNQSTGFKYDVSAILLDPEVKGKTAKVCLFGNNADIIGEYTPEDFRRKMNAGDFVSQASTVVPNMLQRIIDDINNSVCDVAVFISDMKYSPGGAAHSVAMDQYAIDIQNKFASLSDHAVSLISCESNYVSANGSVLSNVFPYYFTIIGESSKVAWVRNQFLDALSGQSRPIGCVDFGVDYGCPKYTAIPSTAIGMSRNNFEFMNPEIENAHSSSFTTFDDNIQPAEVILAVNYRHISQELINSLESQDFSVTSHWGDARASVTVMPSNYKPTVDASLVQNINPNTYLKLTISGLDHYDQDVIKVQMQTRQNAVNCMEKYYGAMAEGDLDRTLSIDGFINGLKRAYPTSANMQNSPMVLFVTKKN